MDKFMDKLVDSVVHSVEHVVHKDTHNETETTKERSLSTGDDTKKPEGLTMTKERTLKQHINDASDSDSDLEVIETSEIDVDTYATAEEFEASSSFPPTIQKPSGVQKKDVKHVLLIYNPESGAHEGVKMAEAAETMFGKYNVKVTPIQLEYKGHAEEICKTRDLEGIDVIAVLGGDGTFHESVNGFMQREDTMRRTVAIAMIAGGTGNSFSLELQDGTKLSESVKHIVRGFHCPIDIGKISCDREDGTHETMYSFNSIHWGLASKVNVTAEKLRWMGKAIRYTTAAALELVNGKKTLARIELMDVDGKRITYEEEFCLVIVNNIMSAAKGMKMAPNAKLNDGLFDILLVRSSSTWDLVTIFRKIYDGSHTDLKEVEYRQVSQFTITPLEVKKEAKKKDEDELTEDDLEIVEEIVDVDGELKGFTPFMCAVLPRTIQVIL